MKKLLIIAVASCFTFTSCSKIEPTSELQKITVSVPDSKPAPPQRYTITNNEIHWGVVEYRLTYLDSNFEKQTVLLPMGKGITLCIIYGTLQTNFAFTMVAHGNC